LSAAWDYRAQFARRLRSLRTKKGFKHARAFALKLGLEENRYTRYERGEVEPNIATIHAICRVLRTEPNDLFGYSNKDTTGPPFECPTCEKIAVLMEGRCKER
jgi:transcriptional regulator with XRE-family HTH domain